MDRQERWDRRYLSLAQQIALWSKDPSTKVGAVIVRPNNTIAATGFNGFPPGHDDNPELYKDREYKYRHVIHAEANAIQSLNEAAYDYTLYASFHCCADCVWAAAKTGIKTLVFPKIDYTDRPEWWVEEWKKRVDLAATVMVVNAIAFREYDV